jgi:hypothetical protein
MTVRRNTSDKTDPGGRQDSPLLDAIRDEFQGRFIPNPPPLYDGDEITFYEAVRRAAGLDPELGLIAWKNHEDLRQALDLLYQRLDWALVNRLGGKGRAESWALDADRTEQEVIRLLEAATDPECPVVAVTIPSPEKRLMPPRVSGVGKYRGAIVAQLGWLRTFQGEYGVIIHDLLSQSHGETDREVLQWAEGWPAGAVVDKGPFPARLSKVAGKWLGRHAGGTMAGFLRAVSDDWSSLSDAQAMDLLETFDLSVGMPTSLLPEETVPR